MMQTTKGPMDERDLLRVPEVDDRPDALVLFVRWTDATGELVRQDAFKAAHGVPADASEIQTARGPIARDRLRRTVELSDRDNEYVIATNWTLDGELVRNDVWVVLKQSSVVASAIAGGF